MNKSPWNIMRPKEGLLFFLSFCTLLAAHSLWIRWAPGVQFDEGWYGVFAHRIANESGFWPIAGNMTSYTLAFPHYVTAFFFKVFGTHLAVYRFSGVVEVCLGIGMISASFWILRQKLAALLFPLIVAFSPALVINHRWVVELTTFCVLTTGMITLGLSLRWRLGPSVWAYALLISGIALGVTAHVVYLAPVLAMWLCLISINAIERKEDRLASAGVALVLLPFFLHIFLKEEDKVKGATLLGLPVLAILFHISGSRSARWVGSILRRALVLPTLVGGILLVPFLLFWEGNWLAKFSNGFLANSHLIGLTLVGPAVLLIYLTTAKRPHGKSEGIQQRDRLLKMAALAFLPISLLGVYTMVIKAGPRYLEAQFLFAAAAFTWFLTRLPAKGRSLVLALYLLSGTAVLGWNYFLPSIQERQVDRIFYFWRWRDGSRGFLPKMRLMDRLAKEGCSISNLGEDEDGSTGISLRFLAIGDWPTVINPPCRLGNKVDILLRNDPNAPDDPVQGRVGEGPFWIVDASKKESAF